LGLGYRQRSGPFVRKEEKESLEMRHVLELGEHGPHDWGIPFVSHLLLGGLCQAG